MKHIKIAFFDIDGTLIDMDQEHMSKTMEDTLLQLQQNGILLCIATGRPLKSIPKFSRITFDAYLTFNASYCCTNDTVIFKNPIPSADINKIVSNANRIHRPVMIASANRMGANGKDQNLIDYFTISNQEVIVIDDFDQLLEEDIYQMMIGCVPSEYDSILQDVKNAKITAWWPRAVDIIPANGGKGLGVQKILEHFHLKKEDAIAFGDGTNDIDMLQAVGTGVAMGNATNNVKQIADDICDTVANEGIYHYCKNTALFKNLSETGKTFYLAAGMISNQ